MPLQLTVNGKPHQIDALESGAPLLQVVEHLELKGDRIAVECNGEIAPRRDWPNLPVKDRDRLEIVHFVGGGCAPAMQHPIQPTFSSPFSR